jgi:CheY-like chemotaxis protein
MYYFKVCVKDGCHHMLPIFLQGMDMSKTTLATPLPNASKLVLIVDDDSFSQELFSEMLMTLGVTDIHTASNGRVGLRTLAALPRHPDLLICDVFMPDMDGIEFTGELAKKGYQGGLILVSGQDITMMSIAQDVAISDGLKMLGAYTKPVPMAILAEVLAVQ